MSITDPLADAFAKIKNAYRARKETVNLKGSKLLLAIMEIFKKEGYIKDYRFIEDDKQGIIRVYLKYVDKNRPALMDIKRISKPGRRVYVNKDEVPRVLRGIGIAVLSTSKGIVTDTQARKLKVGGEVICYVY
ncbi:MAG: 30S ribosomal protein S8 [Candidatus Omnitrophota bacterium]|nr:MAG: 30S ribosomal protein S8 [Candidatus Omnitrophota bacterium]